jgi:hypothetical protein
VVPSSTSSNRMGRLGPDETSPYWPKGDPPRRRARWPGTGSRSPAQCRLVPPGASARCLAPGQDIRRCLRG